MRESTVRGPAVDLGEFERRLRAPERRAPEKADPLGELARLMQQGEAAAVADPYSQILAEPARPRPRIPVQPQADVGLRGAIPPGAPELVAEPRYAEPHAHAQMQSHAHPEPAYPDSEPAYHGAEGGWSEDQYLDYGETAEEDIGYDEPQTGLRRWLKLRPWHAVAALSVLAIGGIGWGFAHRSGVGGSRDIATINAPEGPVKVKPSASEDQGAPTAGAAVLDRRESAPVKQIVTHEEQAVDPTVAPPKGLELGNGPVNAPHERGPNVVAPRKVKTVTVRPDGSRVDDAPLPPAVAKAAAPTAPADAAARTSGGTPNMATKSGATPKAAKPKPPKKVAAAPEAAPGADAVADAATPEPAAAPISKGGYAVQFVAANSEAEARAMIKSVAAKYGSQLGGAKPTFKMATVGDKTVYRVRVGGVSKESATAICGKVKAGGGNCFVAGN